MNIKQSLMLYFSLSFSLSAMATSKWLGKWFEVEVIIISQLDDKAKLKEVFTQPHKTIDDTNAIDLLSAYLNPNIASLKQQLPQCGKPISSTLYSEISPLWSQFHNIKTLPAIETPQAIEALPAINTSSKLISNEELEDGLLATPTSK